MSIFDALKFKSRNYTTKWINIEFSPFCNLRCTCCTMANNSRQYMTREILSKIFDDLSNQKFCIEDIGLWIGGEALLHPDLIDMLTIIKNKKSALKGSPKIILLTNATLLTRELASKILATEALDIMQFSIDGGTKESYEYIRKTSWENVRDNVHAFIDANSESHRPVKTSAICIIPNGYPKETSWMEPDFKKLFSRVDNVDYRNTHNFDGSVEMNIEDERFKPVETPPAKVPKKTPCKFLINDLVIFSNGDVSACCADLNNRDCLGNIMTNTLEEIYLSEKRTAMIDLFKAGKKSEIAYCRNCAGYY